ncbi:MAG: hypothetical protein R8P61_28140 [Bacteroidia bacterium]|nr:hypothetical protein [Bacteroidia bacterium]
MKKTIFLKEENFVRLRQGLNEKLKNHSDNKNLGKSDKLAYEGMATYIREELTLLLKSPEYNRLRTHESQISYHSLWTILYQTEKDPSKRKRMNRMVVMLLILFVFKRIPEDMLIEKEEKLKQTERNYFGKATLTSEGFRYYEEFSLKKLRSSIRKARGEIKIIDTFLDNWRKLRAALKEANKQGCRIRILLNDPGFSPIVARSIRISDIGGGEKSLESSLQKIRNEIKDWENPDLVEISLHDSLPGFNLFGVDDIYYIGLFWHNTEATEGPFMMVSNAQFKTNVNTHFEDLWEYAGRRGANTKGGQGKKLNQKLSPYVGNWLLYCNKVGKDEESFNLRNMEHGKVVENLLNVTEINGELSVSFVSYSNGVFRGKAYLCESNDSFLEIRLISKQNEDTLHFLFHIGNGLENHLIGIYNHMYVKAPVLGTGLTAIVKINPFRDQVEDLGSWKPQDVEEIQDQNVQKLLRYLRFPSGARLETLQSFEHLQNFKRFNLPSLFSGVYKIYSYQGSESNPYHRFISESLIKIDDSHQVFHKRCASKYSETNEYSHSVGRVQASKGDSLIISMKSKDHGRMGFFVINIGDYKPQSRTYYTGVFTGVALRNRRVAIGSRVILEFLGNDLSLYDQNSIKRYSIYKDEIQSIPAEVRENLMGRVNNLVGFLKTHGASSKKALLKESHEGVDMKQVFFDSACQRALSDDVNQIGIAAKMYERAVLHGFRPIHSFEEKLEEYEQEGWINQTIKNGILSNNTYKNLMKAYKDMSN